MTRQTRLKILQKIAQTGSGSAVPASPQTGTTGQQGTQTTNTTSPTQINPSQPSISLSSLFAQISLNVGWDSSRVPYIFRIVNRLDRATNIATNGKYNLRNLWPTFPQGTETQFASPVKDILTLLRKVYEQFLNKGLRYTQQLSGDDVARRLNVLLHAPELGKLEQINPSGPLAKANLSLGTLRKDLSAMMPPQGARR